MEYNTKVHVGHIATLFNGSTKQSANPASMRSNYYTLSNARQFYSSTGKSCCSTKLMLFTSKIVQHLKKSNNKAGCFNDTVRMSYKNKEANGIFKTNLFITWPGKSL
jgi:hypothetical protein